MRYLTRIEETHESYPPHGPTEGFTESFQELVHFVFLFLGLFVIVLTFLPLGESFPRKVAPAMVVNAELEQIQRQLRAGALWLKVGQHN